MAWFSKRDDRVAGTIQEKLDALHRVALRLARDPEAAADLVQETCLRAWRHRDRSRSADPGPWLFCILRRAWIDRWRRERRGPVLVELPEEIQAGPGADPPLQPQNAVDRARLEQCFDDELLAALDDLREEERLVLIFHTFGDMSYREISEAMECPLGTVMSRLHRARSRLRRRLAGYARSRGIVPSTGKRQRDDDGRRGDAQA